MSSEIDYFPRGSATAAAATTKGEVQPRASHVDRDDLFLSTTSKRKRSSYDVKRVQDDQKKKKKKSIDGEDRQDNQYRRLHKQVRFIDLRSQSCITSLFLESHGWCSHVRLYREDLTVWTTCQSATSEHWLYSDDDDLGWIHRIASEEDVLGIDGWWRRSRWIVSHRSIRSLPSDRKYLEIGAGQTQWTKTFASLDQSKGCLWPNVSGYSGQRIGKEGETDRQTSCLMFDVWFRSFPV